MSREWVFYSMSYVAYKPANPIQGYSLATSFCDTTPSTTQSTSSRMRSELSFSLVPASVRHAFFTAYQRDSSNCGLKVFHAAYPTFVLAMASTLSCNRRENTSWMIHNKCTSQMSHSQKSYELTRRNTGLIYNISGKTPLVSHPHASNCLN